MKDSKFWEKALGLEKPWRVKEVKIDLMAKTVDVESECVEKTAWAKRAGRAVAHPQV